MRALDIADIVRVLDAEVYVTDGGRVYCNGSCETLDDGNFLGRVEGRRVKMANVLQALRDHLDDEH